jgi:hypothetical protein
MDTGARESDQCYSMNLWWPLCDCICALKGFKPRRDKPFLRVTWRPHRVKQCAACSWHVSGEWRFSTHPCLVTIPTVAATIDRWSMSLRTTWELATSRPTRPSTTGLATMIATRVLQESRFGSVHGATCHDALSKRMHIVHTCICAGCDVQDYTDETQMEHCRLAGLFDLNNVRSKT